MQTRFGPTRFIRFLQHLRSVSDNELNGAGGNSVNQRSLPYHWDLEAWELG